jgi:hypothetical protein
MIAAVAHRIAVELELTAKLRQLRAEGADMAGFALLPGLDREARHRQCPACFGQEQNSSP